MVFGLLFLSLHFAHAFSCDSIEEQLLHESKDCENMSQASAVTGGVAAAIFGTLGGLVGLIPGAAAKASCDKRDETAEDLKRCIADEKKRLEEYRAQVEQQVQILKLKEELERIYSDYEVALERSFLDYKLKRDALSGHDPESSYLTLLKEYDQTQLQLDQRIQRQRAEIANKAKALQIDPTHVSPDLEET